MSIRGRRVLLGSRLRESALEPPGSVPHIHLDPRRRPLRRLPACAPAEIGHGPSSLRTHTRWQWAQIALGELMELLDVALLAQSGAELT